ncbi:transmembrane protein 230-like [Paramacrobiotus metropolitanus]|uniref:transmembrane protein 230-like n=1 Tax=Paramacrobiotus metropolitanus TaxID=2943436 RepID=UPI002445C023|nr:transmembrane protein 230-like [Paramacrobiotus metropolitanus]
MSKPSVDADAVRFSAPSHVDTTGLRRREFQRDLPTRKDSDDFTDNQFKSYFYDSCAPPIASIWRAVILFVVGTVLTVVGSLLLAGYFDTKYADRTWPVLTLGLLCFIPGAYYTRIAYYAYKGYEGFSYQDIPSD